MATTTPMAINGGLKSIGSLDGDGDWLTRVGVVKVEEGEGEGEGDGVGPHWNWKGYAGESAGEAIITVDGS